MTAKTPTLQRQEFVNAFQGNLEHEGEEIQFIVGPSSILGTGFNLTASRRVYIVECEFMRYREAQGIGRVSRNKLIQHHPKTYSYRFTMRGYITEALILARQESRSAIQEYAFKKAKTRGDIEVVVDNDNAEDEAI